MFKQFEYDRRGDRVRKVRHEAVEARERHLERVTLYQLHVLRQAPSQVGRQLGVGLDGDDPAGACCQPAGQHAKSGTDLQHGILLRQLCVLDLAVSDPIVDEKVLAPALGRRCSHLGEDSRYL